MKKIYLIPFLLLFIACSTKNNRYSGRKETTPVYDKALNEYTKVLKAFNGNWQVEVHTKKAILTPKNKTEKITRETNFILQRNYKESYGTGKDSESMEVDRFDVNSKQYNKWIFHSDGNTSFWIGDWNNSEKLMVWNYIDLAIWE